MAIGKKHINEEKKMKKLTKILVILLSVAFVCTGLLMAVSASSSTGAVAEVTKTVKQGETSSNVTSVYSTLNEALDSINGEEDADVKLLADAKLDEAYSVLSNVSIDLNGYTLTVNAGFVVEKTVDFEIMGYGNIVANSVLVESKTANTNPTITIDGTTASINITKPEDASGASLVVAEVGTYTFKNIKLVSKVMTPDGTFSHTASSTAKFIFKAAELDVKGYLIDHSAVITLIGNGTVEMYNSSIDTDANAISTIGTKCEDQVAILKNCNIKVLQPKTGSNDLQSSAFGSYGPLYGTITVEDSIVESSFRPLIFDCATIDPEAHPNMKIEFKNTKLYMNGYRAGEIGRSLPPTYFDSACSIIIANEASFPAAVAYPTAAISEKHAIFVEPGVRMSSSRLASLGKGNGLTFPDGSTLGTYDSEKKVYDNPSTTYDIIFDPIGDTEAPYVVVALKDSEGNAITPTPSDTVTKGKDDYLYFDNFSGGWSSNTDGGIVVVGGSLNGISQFGGSVYSHQSNWWHPVGSYNHVVTYDKESYFAYYTTKENEVYNQLPDIVFGQPLNATNALLAKDYGLVIYEIDVATATGSYVELTLGLNSRSDPSGGNDTRAAAYVKINSDGSFTGSDKQIKLNENAATAKLSTTSWNRITMVVDTTTANSSGEAYGTTYLYVNGVLIGSCASSFKDGAYLRGMRFTAVQYQAAGKSILFDNVYAKAYKTLPADFDPNNYSALGSGIPYNTTSLETSSISVGPIKYETLNEAIDAALELGTYPSVSGDITGLVVDKDVVILTNGHTIEVTQESFKADIIYARDGSILGYDFKEEYGDMTANVYWFHGDLDNPEHYLNPDNEQYFTKTEVRIGFTPTAPSEITFDTVLDVKKFSEKTHSGWDYDGDGEGAVTLAPLTISDMNKDIYLYPAYENNYFTAIVYDEDANFAEGSYEFIKDDEPLSKLYTAFKSNPGWTLKLLSDFELDAAPNILLSSSGEAYNFDFNGNVLYLNAKGTVFTLNGGANLNVYSSVSGAMFYAVEIKEADSAALMGAGSFIKIDDASAASTINIGTVGSNSGSNLIFAGDCMVEAAAGASGSVININDTTVVRVAFDKAAAILTSEYAGKINVSKTNFILPTGSAAVSSGTAASVLCDAEFVDCSFIFNANSDGTNRNVAKNTSGFNTLKFEGCTTNGRISAADGSPVVIAKGSAAYVMDVADGYTFADGAELAKYNVPMSIPEINVPDFYDADNAGSEGAYVAVIADEVVRIQLWGYSSAKGGAVPNGYLYIYPNGYNGIRYEKSSDASIELPILPMVVTDELVTVTYKGLSDEIIATETYAKGGNILSVEGINVPPVTLGSGAITLVHNGEWTANLPVIGLTGDVTLTPAGSDTAVNFDNIKVSVSLYTDFTINVYIPEVFVQYIQSITYDGETVSYENVVINGENYIKISIKMPSYDASKKAAIAISVAEGDYSVDGTLAISVADYASKILANASSSAADIDLAEYMVEYAYEAAKYFKGNDDAVLASLRGEVEDYKVNTKADISELGAVFESATVDLGKELALVLKVREEFVGRIVVMGTAYVINNDSDEVIVINGLRLADFAENLPIAAYLADGTEVLNSSYALLDAFTAYHIESAKTGNSVSLDAYYIVKAFYNYVRCANDYVNAGK